NSRLLSQAQAANGPLMRQWQKARELDIGFNTKWTHLTQVARSSTTESLPIQSLRAELAFFIFKWTKRAQFVGPRRNQRTRRVSLSSSRKKSAISEPRTIFQPFAFCSSSVRAGI